MAWKWFALVWAFVFVVAVYDVGFAWQYRDHFASWELNPLARWGVDRFGLQSMIGFKFFSLLLTAGAAAYCLSHDHRRLGRVATLIPACLYGLLLLHYTFSNPETDASPERMSAIALSARGDFR